MAARRRNFTLGLSIGAALVIAYQFWHQRRPPSIAAMPAVEGSFVAVAIDARLAWVNAPNDLARVGMRAARAAALCRADPSLAATEWLGTVEKIAPDGFPDYFGKATAQIVIELAPHLVVSTPAAPLLNNPATMVEAGTPLYAAAAKIPIGATVRFSANFMASGGDCMAETSLTDAGSMTEPHFKLQLTALSVKH